MKNTIAVATLLLAFVVPRVTQAAWWNPLTWFARQAPAVEVPIQSQEKDMLSQSIAPATSSPKAPPVIKEVKAEPVVQKTDDRAVEPKHQQEVAEARKRAEEQLRADALKAEIQNQVRVELERIKQAEIAAAEEERQALLRAEEEKNRITISVGESVCRGNKLVLPYEITGPMRGAIIRIFSEGAGGGVDMRSGITANEKAGRIHYGDASDLSPETTSYRVPSESPYLNGTPFHYRVEVYDQKHTSSRKKVIAEQSGDIVIPVCQ